MGSSFTKVKQLNRGLRRILDVQREV